MGVDCHINLPANAKINNVSKVIGVVAGLPARKQDLNYKGAWTVKVDGVNLENASVVSLANITITGKMIDGKDEHSVLYHFEGDGGGRLLMPRSTAFWIAVGKRLVDFFGGTLSYQDCDITEDYSNPANPDNLNCPEDGDDDDWQNLQQRILDLKPITKEELLNCNEFAAYKI